MNIVFCDKEDCLLNPKYVKPVGDTYLDINKIADSINDISTPTIEFNSSILSGKMIFKIDDTIEIPLECLLCKYRKKIDMREHVLSRKAKHLLEEK